MTMSEIDGLKVGIRRTIFGAGTVLLGMWLTSWLERREDRRRPPRIVHLDSTVG